MFLLRLALNPLFTLGIAFLLEGQICGYPAPGSEGGAIGPNSSRVVIVLRPLHVRDQTADILGVSLVDLCRPAQVTFALGRLLGQDVAGISLVAADFAGSALAETLGCTAVGLDFRHCPYSLAIIQSLRLLKSRRFIF